MSGLWPSEVPLLVTQAASTSTQALDAKTRHMCSTERTTIYYIHHQYITHMVCYENITCVPHAYSIFSVLLACWTFCSRSHEILSCLLEMSTFGIHLT